MNEQDRPSLTVHHFGPDIRDVGGMESVLRIVAESSLGADSSVVHGTRSATSRLRTIKLLAGAVYALIKLPSGTVVHVHLSFGGSYLREGCLVVLAHLRGLPVVATNHGSRFPSFAARHPKLVSAVLRRAGVVLCFSSESVDLVHDLAPNVECVLIANPVPTDWSSPPASETCKRALFAGVLGTRKGVDVLLRAWQLVMESHPDAELVLAGPQTDLDLDNAPGVRFIGTQSPSAVRTLLRESRLVVLPSRQEAMPMILSEALAARRPFVSTPVAGIPDLANNVQALVPVGNPDELAREINLLLADSHLAEQRGNAGQAFHIRTRSIEALEPVMRRIYRGVAGGNDNSDASS